MRDLDLKSGECGYTIYRSPSHCTGSWTDPARVELVKKLWADGLSASQIAGRLGGVTRNAVIGKVHRLGLSGRATTSRMKSHRPRKVAKYPTRTSAPAKMKKAGFRSSAMAELYATSGDAMDAARLAPDLIIPITEQRTLLNLEPGDCRWGFGDPKLPGFHFCNRHQVGSSDRMHKGVMPYCEFHAARSTTAAPPVFRMPSKPLPRNMASGGGGRSPTAGGWKMANA